MPTPLPTDENMGLTRPNLSDLVIPTGQTSLSDVQVPADASAVGTPIMGQRLGTSAVRTIDLADPNSGVVQTQVPSDSESDLLDQHAAAAEQMSSQMGVLPPPAPTGKEKIVQHFPDGSFMLDNKVRVFPDGSNSYEREGQKFFQPRFGTPIKIPSQTQLYTNPITKEPMLINKATGEAKAVTMPSAPSLPDNMTKEDALAQLSQMDQQKVQDFIKMQRPPFGRAGALQPDFARLEPYIMKADPNYNPSNYAPAQSMRMEYTSQKPGTPGWNITALNTAIDHMASLKDKADALKNVGWTDANTIANMFSKHAGDPRVSAFKSEYNIVTNEIEKAITGTAPHVWGREQYEKALDVNSSPAQFQSVLGDALPKLLSDRAAELGSAWESTFKEPYPVLRKNAVGSLNKLGVKGFYGQDSGSVAPPPLADGIYTDKTTGKLIRVKDGQQTAL